MRRFLLQASIVLLLVSLMSCGKSYWQLNYEGAVYKATINGEPWSPLIIGHVPKNREETFDIQLDTYNKAQRLSTNLSINFIPKGEGWYSLARGGYGVTATSATYTTLDGDVVLSHFRLDTTWAYNYISITSFSSFWNHVEGSFEVKFIKDGTQNKPRTIYNTIHIVCPGFETAIKKW